MRDRPLLLLFEALIPLLGFYFWNWNLAFILCFYFLDALAMESLCYFQTRYLKRHRNEKPKLVWPIISGTVLIAGILGWVFWIEKDSRYKGFFAEFGRFLKYEDLGFPQGFFLLPLIILNVWMKFRIEFVNSAAWKRTSVGAIWKDQFWRNLQLPLVGFLALLTTSWTESQLLWVLVLFPVLLMLMQQRVARRAQ